MPSALARHLTAEVKTQEFISGKGVVTKWEVLRKQNHWLDALYLACVAGHGCGVRLMGEEEPQKAPQRRGTIKFAGQEQAVDMSRFSRPGRW